MWKTIHEIVTYHSILTIRSYSVVLQDHIAWTDKYNNTITWADRANGSIVKQVSTPHSLGAIIMFDIYGQPPVDTGNTNK